MWEWWEKVSIKYLGSLCASNSSYMFWVEERWKGRWVRILLLDVPLLSLIFLEVVLVWCLVGRTKHSESATGVSPLVAGSRAPGVPVGNVCVEGPSPPLGIFLLDNHCIKVSCSIGSPVFLRRKWSLYVHSCGLAQSCNAACGADSRYGPERRSLSTGKRGGSSEIMSYPFQRGHWFWMPYFLGVET